jgi:cytochrome c2
MSRRRWVGTALLAILLGSCRTRVPEVTESGITARGKEAITKYGCGACHHIAGVPGAHGRLGPSLDGIGSRRLIAGTLPNTPDFLVRWIVMPQSITPGSAMPNLGVSDADARDIAAYLLRK